ncbi:MAG TPA: histidine kinase, partial [Flavobacterium sp.]|nr:histidine kinase [Flavobacterium sp.]
IGLKRKLIANENELSFLKHQLNPHFLLNAINNLYGVSLAEPEIVSEKILELADLLHYQLDAIKKNTVLLADEIAFCKNYIAYMQYKSNNLKVETAITGNFQNKKIHTLLFLPLIENAIKYASETQNPQVNINWLLDKDCLIFTISNTFTANNSKAKGTEIGLANLKRRLEILDAKSELTITENDFFKVQLTLWI